jgi:hypothetical protein
MGLNPKALLDDALELIAHDLKHIRVLVEASKLDDKAAQDLARYSSSLLAISKAHEKDDEDQLKSLSKLPYEDLVKMAEKAIGNYGSDPNTSSNGNR